MNLSLNEIKTRATAFAKDWEQTEGREEADAKEFLIDFLNIFGISRKRVATFEHRVKKLSEADGYIDLLWKGRLLVEMKSKGKDLSKAYTQAKEYCHGLKEHELPELIMVSDFYHVKVYDTDGQETAFTLPQLLQYITVFYPLAGIQKRTFADQDPVNIKAAELMGQLHDELKAIGYEGHPLELYLVRLLFLLFADDTSIFERGIFQEYIDRKTNEDGSDLAMHLHALFGVLNTPPDKRLKTLDEHLMQFPYVNGKLFEENLPVAAFSSSMRRLLLQCCTLDWGKISPAIFGSLFQSVMDPTERRNLGAHYTSEKNILKVIQPLFLDELKAEHGNIRHDKNKLKKLHQRISQLRFLDPACGCGNFLIIAYRELRLLEMDIVKDLLQGQIVTDIGSYFLLDVDQFYGIEYEEFPAQIAQVAMWLMDHQMNLQASQTFGEYYVRLPLRKSATIVHGNALRIDWQSIIKTMPWDANGARFDYIMGNPPF
nr:class I SAM-dependent DNA methyltransferase [Phnomibacter ginsenosidimutans]